MPKKYKTHRRKALRRKKKSFFNRFLFSTIAFFSILLLSAAAFILFAPNFQIKELNITGNTGVSTEDLQKLAEKEVKQSFSIMGMDFTTESIFLSFGKGMDTVLKAFPQIETISIQQNFPNGLSIHVTEKTPFAVWCEKYGEQKCYLLDKSGSYIKDSEQESGDSLLNIAEQDKVDLGKKDMLAALSRINEELAKEQINIRNIELFKDKIIANTNLKCQLIFAFADDLDWQIEKLKIVVNNNKYSDSLDTMSYIDLRFGNQAIIK